jgi:nucleoside 2-deoxyribosyltransferase
MRNDTAHSAIYPACRPDIVVDTTYAMMAHLTPFRGPDIDVGPAYEMG